MRCCQLLVSRFDLLLCFVVNWKASTSSRLFGLDKNRWSGMQLAKWEWYISWSLQHLERWQQFGNKDLRGQKTQCPCVQIFQLSQCHRAVCHPVDFYHASRLIHLWTSMKYFTHKINLSVKFWTTEHSSVYNESVFSTITSTLLHNNKHNSFCIFWVVTDKTKQTTHREMCFSWKACL